MVALGDCKMPVNSWSGWWVQG